MTAPPARHVPKLLVSVRETVEAAAALEGGCDLLDIKDPSAGPLGRPARKTIEEVIAARDQIAPGIPVSVALGDLSDRELRDTSASLLPPKAVHSVKLGFARTAGRSDCADTWNALRQTIHSPLEQPLEWIAVAYADADAARAPDWRAILRLACETGCDGLLVDTWDKSAPGVLQQLGARAIATIARECRRCGLPFALSGRLSASDIRSLAPWSMDIIGVRSAACHLGERKASVCASRVRDLRQLLSVECVPDASTVHSPQLPPE